MTTMTAEKINDLRKRIVDGQPVSDEELIEALRYRMEQRAAFTTRTRKAAGSGEDKPAPKAKPLSAADAQLAFDNLKI